MNYATLVWVMVVLWVGGFLGGLVVGMIPSSVPLAYGWVGGFLIAIIQILLLSVFGVLSKTMSLMTLLIGAVLILVGGLIGGFVADWIALSGWFLTIITLLIQSLLLMGFGVVKKSGAGPSLPS